MDKFTVLFLTLFASVTFGLEEKNEPMVAFLCNRPSMYRTERGWIKDDNTGCLRDPVDILNYCRKVFPHLDVRNVVESSEKVTIDNWCAFGHKTCRHQFTVRPFRCLVGLFQSDALLVPEHCIFDHVHDSKLCTSYSEWNKTATRSCDGRAMNLQSFSMLQPCGIDRFNGVEFVCCPSSESVRDAETKPARNQPLRRHPVGVKRVPATTTTTTTTTTAAPVVEDDVYTSYLNRAISKPVNNPGHKWNEHDYFAKAMDDMKRHHEDKINKMMKEWAAARQRVQELKQRDPKAAEKLNKEITTRFQKTYDSLEVEHALERKQLTTLHQQRVQAELNEKKRRALDDFMQAIDDNRDPVEILRTLKQYIKVVQKDRLHTVNRYKHLRDVDPAEAEALRPELAEHLRTVDQQMTSTLSMLDRVPKYKKKVQLQIDDYLDAYHAVDSSVGILLRSLNPTTTLPPPRDDYEEEDDDEQTDDHTDDDESYDEDDGDDEEDDDEMIDDENDESDEEDEDDDDQEGGHEVVQPVVVSEQKPADGSTEKLPRQKKVGGREDVSGSVGIQTVVKEEEKEEQYDEETDEKVSEEQSSEDEDDEEEEEEEATVDNSKEEYEYSDSDEILPTTKLPTTTLKGEYYFPSHDVDSLDQDTRPEPAHVQQSVLSAKEASVMKTSSKGVQTFGAALPLGLAVGAITILVVIAVGVIVLRRRAARRMSRATVNVRLDPAATPEERHIAAMQMTGYENPTYKYFEMSGTASA